MFALDVYRLLQAIPTDDLAGRLARLRDSQEAGEVTAAAIEQLRVLFGARSGAGIELAVRATRVKSGGTGATQTITIVVMDRAFTYRDDIRRVLIAGDTHGTRSGYRT